MNSGMRCKNEKSLNKFFLFEKRSSENARNSPRVWVFYDCGVNKTHDLRKRAANLFLFFDETFFKDTKRTRQGENTNFAKRRVPPVINKSAYDLRRGSDSNDD